MMEDSNFSTNKSSGNASARTQRQLPRIFPTLWIDNKTLIGLIKGEHAAKKRKGGVYLAYPFTIDALMVVKIKACCLKWLDKSLFTFQTYLNNRTHTCYDYFGQSLSMLHCKVARVAGVAMSNIVTALHCSNKLKMKSFSCRADSSSLFLFYSHHHVFTMLALTHTTKSSFIPDQNSNGVVGSIWTDLTHSMPVKSFKAKKTQADAIKVRYILVSCDLICMQFYSDIICILHI